MSKAFAYSSRPQLASELVSFAKTTGMPVTALAFSDEDAAALSDCGADRVLALDGAARPVESNAKALAELLDAEEAALLAVEATPVGRDLAAQVAGYLDCALAGDVSSAEWQDGAVVAVRSEYGGNVAVTEKLACPAVVTMGAGHFEAASGTAPVEHATIQGDPRVTVIEEKPVAHEGVDVSQAKRIVAVGMGLKAEDDLEMVRSLASELDAELGCSRGISEDRKWLPPESYIGLSGADVAPDLYLALGISGQAQHVAGIRDSKVIVAVDTNADAPIFKSADYGVVADLYELVPALTKALANS